MVVIGGIVGAGIFRNPHVVATYLDSPVSILSAWLLGGLVALAGAFIYAELASSRPAIGGQYAFFREAYHPGLAFLYGWALLWVGQTGGMAAVSITFGDYALRLMEAAGADGLVHAARQLGQAIGLDAGKLLAIVALALLTLVNCLGVRLGTAVQSGLTLLKMLAIAGLVLCGLFLIDGNTPPPVSSSSMPAPSPAPLSPIAQFGAAMVPVLFAYGGWQTACFVAGEIKQPKRNLPLALILGVFGVLALYLSVNWVCLRALGPEGLAKTTTPAADVATMALGAKGSFLISAGIVISTLGFLSQGMLTAPRVYYAMAQDGLFFRTFARIHPATNVPVAAIALQGAMAILIALSGRYEQILNYVVSVDFIFYGLTATCIFIFRRRDARSPGGAGDGFRLRGHPFVTLFFIACCWLVVINSVYAEPLNSLIGLGLMLTGIPIYYFWKRRRQTHDGLPSTV